MGKINILDHDVASKIAAGEVIERPVSVVKELIENSIDAGCKNIIVEIEKGGKRSIKVTDDGKGMLREDVKLAFKRHATSKISMADDIFSINTLGFRGEALASIAAVSKLTAVTKTSEDVIGTLCKISGGVIKEFGEVATTNGCQIEVRDLFYNTPARLKFLSNDTYEVSRITDLVMRFATGNIDTSFRLIVDGKELFYASGNGDYKEVIAKIHGVDLAREIISIEKVFEKGRIWGYISKPNFNRGNRTGQTFFVNHRFVKDTGLTFCLERAYKTMLPIRRFPISIIFIDIENSQIDVNVHPSKMKIKFRNENLVHKALFHAVNDNLRKNTLIPNETFDTPHAHKPKTIDTQAQLKFDYDPSDNMSGPIDDSEMYKKPTVVKESNKELPIIQDQNSFDAFSNPNVKSQSETLAGRESENLEFSTHKFGFTRILGQLFHTYIIAEGKEKFYLIDQHAAHERILYELYSDKYAKTSDSQNLITPYVLHLSAQEVLLIENYKKTITRMGFDFSVFGTDSVLIRSVPYILNKPADPLTLRDIIDAINSNDYNEYPEKKRLIISMACHAAIKAGDVLSSMEIKDLLKQLEKTVNPYTCPHGRPTIISMTLYELEKSLKGHNKMQKDLLIVIVGPTAVGKTDISIEVARKIKGEVISADSMQIYRHMDIGTAKPPLEQRKGILHHMIDIINPDEEFNVANFQARARLCIKNIHESGKIPLMTGGTGLYINSVCYNYTFPEAARDFSFRKQLQNIAQQYGNTYVYKKLEKVDPKAAKKIHPNNLRRVIRALEVYEKTGKRFSYYEAKTKGQQSQYDLLFYGLTMPKERLYKRINDRVLSMIDSGLVGEVQTLLKMGYKEDLNSMQALGYRQIIDYLKGRTTLDEAIYLIARDTRRYAKRQYTWFLRDKNIIWFDTSEEKKSKTISNIIQDIEGKIKNA